MTTDPVEPLYPFGPPGHSVELHFAEMELAGMGKGLGNVWLTLNGRLSVDWEIHLDRSATLGEAVLCLARPELGSVEIPVAINHSAGRGTVPGTELGGGQPMRRVIVHWVNVPPIYSVTAPASGRTGARGRWQCRAAGWDLSIEEREDLNEVVRELNASRQQALTHVGELRRTDGAEFSASHASNALFGFQLCLSFALGRWVAPALPVGFGDEGKRVWEQWAPWRCDNYSGFLHWWDTHTGDDLADFVARFMKAWTDSAERDLVWHMAYNTICANHGGTTVEGRIMLAQASLEYLAWTTYVLSGQLTKNQYKKLETAEHLRRLLTAASIPTTIPSEFNALRAVAAQHRFDGAQVLTWVRNRLVHPKDAGEPYKIRNTVQEAWLLAMHYAELLLLYRLAYTGSYLPRFPPHRFEHDRVTVPWG